MAFWYSLLALIAATTAALAAVAWRRRMPIYLLVTMVVGGMLLAGAWVPALGARRRRPA